jgi:lysine biosynthesis protein LysW
MSIKKVAEIKTFLESVYMKKTPSKNKKMAVQKKTSQTPNVFVSHSDEVPCPECHAMINIEGGEIGDYLECETCFAELTLGSLQPPTLELVEEEK